MGPSVNPNQMDMFAQMQGFPSAGAMMASYQENMMTMMQSVLAPVMTATADIVSSHGGRGAGRMGRGRGQFFAGRGRGGANETGVALPAASGVESGSFATGHDGSDFVRGGGGGFYARGRGRGGRVGGRVPFAGNKTWVREPEVSSSLPAKR